MSSVFSASTRQISHVSEVFQAASAIDSQGLIVINSKGIIIYCESNHILNYQCVLDISLFTNFNLVIDESSRLRESGTMEDAQSLFVDTQFSEDSQQVQTQPGAQLDANQTGKSGELRFGVDLSLIGHAFEVLDNKDITCYLSYNGQGTPFVIEFEDNYISESIEFLTFYVDLVYPYDAEETDNELLVNYSELDYELILKSDLLTNLLQDLQQINTRELFVFIQNYVSNELNFVSSGPIGFSKLIYPNEKTILEKLEIYNGHKALSCFKFAIFWKVFRSVKLSSKCKILRDSGGVFSIQLICKDSSNNNYIGSLITINMLEVDHDITISDLEGQFKEVETHSIKRRRIAHSDYDDREEIDVPLFL